MSVHYCQFAFAAFLQLHLVCKWTDGLPCSTPTGAHKWVLKLRLEASVKGKPLLARQYNSTFGHIWIACPQVSMQFWLIESYSSPSSHTHADCPRQFINNSLGYSCNVDNDAHCWSLFGAAVVARKCSVSTAHNQTELPIRHYFFIISLAKTAIHLTKKE